MPAFGIFLLIFAHAADYATFLVMVARHGIRAELNPIVSRIAEEHGLALLTVAKASAVLLVAATFLILLRTRPRLGSAVLAIGIFVGGVGAYSNVLST